MQNRRRITLISHNIWIGPRRTSMRLEAEEWDAIGDVCRQLHCTRDDLVSRAVREHPKKSQTSALRVFLMNFYRQEAMRQVA